MASYIKPATETPESTDSVLRVQVVDSAGTGLAGGQDGQQVDTELPAAAALADNTDNPTAPAVGAFLHVWDGSAWDRLPGTAANGVEVTVSAGAIGFLADHPVDNTGATATIKTADLNATSDGDNEVIAAVASKKIWILSIYGAATAAGLITFKDGATVKKRFRASAAGAGFVQDGGLDAPFIIGSTNTAFNVNCAAGVDFEGGVTYIELP